MPEIQYITKTDRYSAHERIRSIGGREPDGRRWSLSQEIAIRKIEIERIPFWVEKSGRRVRVIIGVSRYGNKYLKTEADGEQPNNLLSLAECPI